MPDDPNTTEELPPISGAITQPVGIDMAPSELTGSPRPAGQLGGDDTDIADDDEWPIRSPRAGLRLKYPTAVLVALLIGAGGLWGGAALQRAHGTTNTGSAASNFARLFSSRGSSGISSGGFSGFSSTGAAAGIVTTIEGNTLYVTTASGGLVKVLLGTSTTYTREAKSTASAMQPGDTVIVQGTKEKNGTVDATSVADTAAGVSVTG
ncbi:MAG: hypothetical protein ABSA65_10595 [Acidimicrobiales bacterium]|jgi:hypothetical protein